MDGVWCDEVQYEEELDGEYRLGSTRNVRYFEDVLCM
jgi:hypothetical protein